MEDTTMAGSQINHNISAMVTQHALYNNNSAMSKSLERLSTGLKINRAQDDAAGLAVSEQMRAQIRGFGKAKQNAQDGVALLQIAEGGAAEITNILQRQRELAVQAANDTLTNAERKYLNDEFRALRSEITRISMSTNYNGMNLLNSGDGTEGKNFGAAGAFAKTLQVGPNYNGGYNGDPKGADYKAGAANQITVSYAVIDVQTLGTGSVGTGTTLALSTIGNQSGAQAAIDSLDNALKSVNTMRAKIGSYINRLEYTINNIANLENNTQDAESRIRDTDFATETTNFTKNQIMVQSATSMLAQANSLPQSVLGLLG
jgi:flagellin